MTSHRKNAGRLELHEGIKLAICLTVETVKKKILIIDEAGFSRVCSAILEKEGYGTDTITDMHRYESAALDREDIGLVITSYPYGTVFLVELGSKRIPTIILSDRFSEELTVMLKNFDKSISYCMIKPLDYTKFRMLVNTVMRAEGMSRQSGYEAV